MPTEIPVYHGLGEDGRQQLIEDITAAYAKAAARVPDALLEPEDDQGETIGPTSEEPIEIPEFPDLIGIDASVYRQINGALKAGKQHLMLYGPPGTGKTTLAQRIAGILHDNSRLITGSADWTSQDIIGGYQPVGEGIIKFVPGILLKNFDRPLIIDELNRCDIDKVIGPLFTILSGQPTSLPYRTDITDVNSPTYEILPNPKPGAADHEFAPKQGWRIIATINSIDKAALYQMSFALTRRFGWIYVDIPKDTEDFIHEYLRMRGIATGSANPDGEVPLAKIWNAVNSARVIGPAPIIDIIKTVHAIDPTVDFESAPRREQVAAYLDGFYMYLMPMLDGISIHESEAISARIVEALRLPDDGEDAGTLKRRLANLSV